MASNKALINDLTEGPINRQILSFSAPEMPRTSSWRSTESP